MAAIVSHDGQEIKPELRVIAIESTQKWCGKTRAKAGRLFEVYLFDFRRHVHCYSLIPYSELHWITTIYTREFPGTPEGERERDALEMKIMDGNRDQPWVEYVDAWRAEGLPFIDLSAASMDLYDHAHDDFDTEEELHEAILEALREHIQGNTPDYHALIDAQRAPG